MCEDAGNNIKYTQMVHFQVTPLQQGAILKMSPEFHSDVSLKDASKITLLMLLPDS